VGGEDGVYQSGFAEPRLTCCKVSAKGFCDSDLVEILTNADNVELEAALQEFALNLSGNAVETHMALGNHGVRIIRHDDRRRHDCGHFTGRDEPSLRMACSTCVWLAWVVKSELSVLSGGLERFGERGFREFTTSGHGEGSR
jgi:hypothetical protein